MNIDDLNSKIGDLNRDLAIANYKVSGRQPAKPWAYALFAIMFLASILIFKPQIMGMVTQSNDIVFQTGTIPENAMVVLSVDGVEYSMAVKDILYYYPTEFSSFNSESIKVYRTMLSVKPAQFGLPTGEYTVTGRLTYNGQVIEAISKDVVIGASEKSAGESRKQYEETVKQSLIEQEKKKAEAIALAQQNNFDSEIEKTRISQQISNPKIRIDRVAQRKSADNTDLIDLDVSENGNSIVKFKGLKDSTQLTDVRKFDFKGRHVKADNLDAEIKSEAVYVSPVVIESAEVTLLKTGPVNTILYCAESDWNIPLGDCNSWQTTTTPFSDLGDRITFTVTHFTTYAGGWVNQSMGVSASTNYSGFEYNQTKNVSDNIILFNNLWTRLNPTTAPPARTYPAMAYDSSAGVAILFGGSGSNDTWVYNYTSNNWTNMNPTSAPSSGGGHMMAYDSSNNVTILFDGGNKTWVYNYSSNNWTNMTPTNMPNPRSVGVMVYDSANKVTILFGGNNGSSYLADTWAYNYSSNNWTNMNPGSNPGARATHAMAYDSTENVTVLFGGTNGGNGLTDTWIYNYSANNWINRNPASRPAGTKNHAMVYDSANKLTILFGGQLMAGYYSDTLVYNYSTNNWTNIYPANAFGNMQHAMAYDSANKVIIHFGGFTTTNQTWSYKYNYLLNGTYTSTLALNQSVIWERIYYQNTTLDGTNITYQIATSADNLTWTSFTGPDLTTATYYNNSGDALNASNSQYLKYRFYLSTNDTAITPILSNITIKYNYSTTDNGTSSSDTTQLVIWDSSDLGSYGNYVTFYANLTNFSLGVDANSLFNYTWTNKTPASGPSARAYHEMEYDSQNKVMVMHGGHVGSFNAETWMYNLTNNTWTQKASNPSTARYVYAMAYDTDNKVMVVFGGDNGARLNDTWIYNLTNNTWTNKAPATYPPARSAHTMEYDSDSKVMVMYGGTTGSNQYDTWIYNLTNNSWTNMTPTTAPPARQYPAMAYDPENKVMVMYGGSTGPNQYDTWIYNLTNNSWTNMTPTTNPPARNAHAMDYDPDRKVMVMYGGTTGTAQSDIWIYNLSINTWTNTTPTITPPARSLHAMTYDTENKAMIIFGGTAPGYSNDVWSYKHSTIPCTFSENSSGSWSAPEAMNHNTSSGIYTLSKYLSGPASFRVYCNGTSAGGYADVNISEPVVGTINICDEGDALTECNVTTSHAITADNYVLQANNIRIRSGGVINTTSSTNTFNITLTGNLTVETGGKISANKSRINAAENITIYADANLNIGNITYTTLTVLGNLTTDTPINFTTYINTSNLILGVGSKLDLSNENLIVPSGNRITVTYLYARNITAFGKIILTGSDINADNLWINDTVSAGNINVTNLINITNNGTLTALNITAGNILDYGRINNTEGNLSININVTGNLSVETGGKIETIAGSSVSAGNITITADVVNVSGTIFSKSKFCEGCGTVLKSTVFINSQSFHQTGTIDLSATSSGWGGSSSSRGADGGSLNIQSGTIKFYPGSSILSEGTSLYGGTYIIYLYGGNGGTISLTGENVTFQGYANLNGGYAVARYNAYGGRAGSILINGTRTDINSQLDLYGGWVTDTNSASGGNLYAGPGGNVTIITDTLNINATIQMYGGKVDLDTSYNYIYAGAGGNATIIADNINITDKLWINATGGWVETTPQYCTSPCSGGSGGNITITAGNITAENSLTIYPIYGTSNTSNGNYGNVLINTPSFNASGQFSTYNISIDNTGLLTIPAGGYISTDALSSLITIQSGANVTIASGGKIETTAGAGQTAGNITIATNTMNVSGNLSSQAYCLTDSCNAVKTLRAGTISLSNNQLIVAGLIDTKAYCSSGNGCNSDGTISGGKIIMNSSTTTITGTIKADSYCVGSNCNSGSGGARSLTSGEIRITSTNTILNGNLSSIAYCTGNWCNSGGVSYGTIAGNTIQINSANITHTGNIDNYAYCTGSMSCNNYASAKLYGGNVTIISTSFNSSSRINNYASGSDGVGIARGGTINITINNTFSAQNLNLNNSGISFYERDYGNTLINTPSFNASGKFSTQNISIDNTGSLTIPNGGYISTGALSSLITIQSGANVTIASGGKIETTAGANQTAGNISITADVMNVSGNLSSKAYCLTDSCNANKTMRAGTISLFNNELTVAGLIDSTAYCSSTTSCNYRYPSGTINASMSGGNININSTSILVTGIVKSDSYCGGTSCNYGASTYSIITAGQIRVDSANTVLNGNISSNAYCSGLNCNQGFSTLRGNTITINSANITQTGKIENIGYCSGSACNNYVTGAYIYGGDTIITSTSFNSTNNINSSANDIGGDYGNKLGGTINLTINSTQFSPNITIDATGESTNGTVYLNLPIFINTSQSIYSNGAVITPMPWLLPNSLNCSLNNGDYVYKVKCNLNGTYQFNNPQITNNSEVYVIGRTIINANNTIINNSATITATNNLTINSGNLTLSNAGKVYFNLNNTYNLLLNLTNNLFLGNSSRISSTVGISQTGANITINANNDVNVSGQIISSGGGCTGSAGCVVGKSGSTIIQSNRFYLDGIINLMGANYTSGSQTHGGSGGDLIITSPSTYTFSNSLISTDGGKGDAGGSSPAYGGGSGNIQIISNNFTQEGIISSNGGLSAPTNAYAGNGSTISIQSPIYSLNSSLNSKGGDAYGGNQLHYGGAGGSVLINSTQMNLYSSARINVTGGNPSTSCIYTACKPGSGGNITLIANNITFSLSNSFSAIAGTNSTGGTGIVGIINITKDTCSLPGGIFNPDPNVSYSQPCTLGVTANINQTRFFAGDVGRIWGSAIFGDGMNASGYNTRIYIDSVNKVNATTDDYGIYNTTYEFTSDATVGQNGLLANVTTYTITNWSDSGLLEFWKHTKTVFNTPFNIIYDAFGRYNISAGLFRLDVNNQTIINNFTGGTASNVIAD